jgi:DNA polymerase
MDTKRRPGRVRAAQLAAAREESAGCKRCDLWKRGTQTVFGEGPPSAALMLVGEQPGDREDVEGRPFVGPAGQLLREALQEAGIEVARVYLTNAVKHFKWVERGKRRIHDKPNRDQILACRYWLDGEIAAVKPRVLVALGATAASVITPGAKVLRDRAKKIASPLAPVVTLTVHPSSILRAGDSAGRAAARRAFIRDLRAIARMLEEPT